MTATQNDDDLIIIEDDNTELSNINDNLIDLDNSENNELISFDDEIKINETEEILEENDPVFNFKLNLNEYKQETNSNNLELNLDEEKENLNSENLNNNLLDFSFDEDKKEDINLENSIAIQSDLNMNDLELDNNADKTSEDENLDIFSNEKETNNNEIQNNELVLKENIIESNLNLEENNKETLVLEENSEELEEKIEINNEETLDTILDFTIAKLLIRKESIDKKINHTRDDIKEIEIEVKNLQEERRKLLAEVTSLESENKKIDENTY